MTDPVHCLTILSTKSAGSSILQALLQRTVSAKLVAKTRHFENETLWWTKCASALGMAQRRMPLSEVPLPKPRAVRDLETLLRENAVPGGIEISRDGCFDAFERLAEAHAPVFVEKSPHHLYQPAALELIQTFARTSARVQMRMIGLVRNPIDTVYSSWRRFGVLPAREEAEWRRAYANLQALAAAMPDHVVILRYEDLVDDPAGLMEPLRQWGLSPAEGATGLHARSVARWRSDPRFRFVPAPETRAMARALGYADDTLVGVPGNLLARDRLRAAWHGARHRWAMLGS
ncbi:MAG: sulfotransferase [Pseudomonadota bacterium]